MTKNFSGWRPPDHWTRVTTIDMHPGGEPLRVVVDGLPPIEGQNVLEKRRYFREHYDYLRTGLMWEPRGHADRMVRLSRRPLMLPSTSSSFTTKATARCAGTRSSR